MLNSGFMEELFKIFDNPVNISEWFIDAVNYDTQLTAFSAAFRDSPPKVLNRLAMRGDSPFGGSTMALTNASGALMNKYAYDEFGNPATNSSETIANPFKYVGRFGVMTDAQDLLYMRARYYSSSVGRFINKDPIGLAGGLNMYGYVGNNPINWVDPEGLAEIHPDYTKLGEKLIHAGKYRFNRCGELTEHTGRVIGKPTGKAARVLKHLKNKFPNFFTDVFPFFILPPELRADPASVFFDPTSELLWS